MVEILSIVLYRPDKMQNLSSPPVLPQTKPLPTHHKMAYENTRAHGQAHGLPIALYTECRLALQDLSMHKDTNRQHGALLAGRIGPTLVANRKYVRSQKLILLYRLDKSCR